MPHAPSALSTPAAQSQTACRPPLRRTPRRPAQQWQGPHEHPKIRAVGKVTAGARGACSAARPQSGAVAGSAASQYAGRPKPPCMHRAAPHGAAAGDRPWPPQGLRPASAAAGSHPSLAPGSPRRVRCRCQSGTMACWGPSLRRRWPAEDTGSDQAASQGMDAAGRRTARGQRRGSTRL